MGPDSETSKIIYAIKREVITCPVRQFITCLRQNVTCLVSTYTLARPHTQQIGTKRQGEEGGRGGRKYKKEMKEKGKMY